MMRSLLVRGMIAGLLAGIVAFTVAKTIGEPEVDIAIAFEEYTAEQAVDVDAPHGDATVEEEELVTRSQQNFAGLGTGALLYGVALGGLFAIVFGLAYGRLGTSTAKGTAAVLGLLGFVAVFLVPALKYPATPPAIGNPDTIGDRSAEYLGLILVSVLLMVLAVVVRRRLELQLGAWNATLVAGLGYTASVVVAWIAFPGVNEIAQESLPGVVPAVGDLGITFPPSVLWRFRLSAFAVQASLWATVAIVFGLLAHQLLDSRHPAEPERVSATR